MLYQSVGSVAGFFIKIYQIACRSQHLFWLDTQRLYENRGIRCVEP
jgi:hypothetical protein